MSFLVALQFDGTKIQQEYFFQHYNYLDAKLDPFTSTKRREM